MVDWWSETEEAILNCLREAGALSPKDLAHRVAISDGEAIVFLCMLAKEEKVAIRLVECAESVRRTPRRRATAPVMSGRTSGSD